VAARTPISVPTASTRSVRATSETNAQ
jgi:hypothetical protein